MGRTVPLVAMTDCTYTVRQQLYAEQHGMLRVPHALVGVFIYLF